VFDPDERTPPQACGDYAECNPAAVLCCPLRSLGEGLDLLLGLASRTIRATREIRDKELDGGNFAE